MSLAFFAFGYFSVPQTFIHEMVLPLLEGHALSICCLLRNYVLVVPMMPHSLSIIFTYLQDIERDRLEVSLLSARVEDSDTCHQGAVPQVV